MKYKMIKHFFIGDTHKVESMILTKDELINFIKKAYELKACICFHISDKMLTDVSCQINLENDDEDFIVYQFTMEDVNG